MEVITGIFHFAADATHTAERLREIGIPQEQVRVVTPETSGQGLEGAIPVEETEGPGVGTVLGGLVSGVLALTLSPFFVSGGPFAAIGRTGVTVIVVLGAVTLGIVLGRTIEKTATRGIPRDDLFLFEEALRRGRSILVTTTEAPTQAATIRRELKAGGAEPVDAFGANWWKRLREVEQAHYEALTGRAFAEAEPAYRRGYDLALHRAYRGRPYEAVAKDLEARQGDRSRVDDFRRGYERGQAYVVSRAWMVTSPAPQPPPASVPLRTWWR